MRTNINYTNEILGGYLMDNNEVNEEYLAEQIIDYGDGRERLYNECFNTRGKTRNVAINWMMDFINDKLQDWGYRGYYATNQQVMKFDREHGNSLERMLDIVEAHVKEEREEA